MAHAEQAFTTAGFAVKRNHPYAGGYTTATTVGRATVCMPCRRRSIAVST